MKLSYLKDLYVEKLTAKKRMSAKLGILGSRLQYMRGVRDHVVNSGKTTFCLLSMTFVLPRSIPGENVHRLGV